MNSAGHGLDVPYLLFRALMLPLLSFGFGSVPSDPGLHGYLLKGSASSGQGDEFYLITLLLL